MFITLHLPIRLTARLRSIHLNSLGVNLLGRFCSLSVWTRGSLPQHFLWWVLSPYCLLGPQTPTSPFPCLSSWYWFCGMGYCIGVVWLPAIVSAHTLASEGVYFSRTGRFISGVWHFYLNLLLMTFSSSHFLCTRSALKLNPTKQQSDTKWVVSETGNVHSWVKNEVEGTVWRFWRGRK